MCLTYLDEEKESNWGPRGDWVGTIKNIYKSKQVIAVKLKVMKMMIYDAFIYCPWLFL